MREVTNEADGIAEEDFGSAFELPFSCAGIEGCEEAVFDISVGVGEGVEECAFADVCVTHKTNLEYAFSAVDFADTAFVDIFEFAFEIGDAFAYESSVGFELLSPGPRVPMPPTAPAVVAPPAPATLSKCDHIRARRG